MSANPTISVVMPSFNQGAYIEESIRSVIDQDWESTELIVVDGGSSDGTVETIRQFEDRIAWWTSEPDEGQSDAINKGIGRSTGEIVTWLNSDDLLLPGTLRLVAGLLADTPAGMLFGRARIFDASGELPATRDEVGFEPMEPGRMLAGAVAQPSAFFRRRALEEVGGVDPSLHFAMDYDLQVRVILTRPVIELPDRLWGFRLHGESKTVARSEGFPRDLARVFCRVLRSFDTDTARRLIEEVRALGLYDDAESSYPIRESFSELDLRRALLHFLRGQISYAYNNAQLDRVRLLSRRLAELDRGFYDRHRIGRLHRRARWLTAPALGFLRRFSR